METVLDIFHISAFLPILSLYQLHAKLYIQNKTNAISLESVDGLVPSLALGRSMSMSVFSYTKQSTLCLSHFHAPYMDFRVFTLLHFVSRRGGGKDQSTHTLLGYSLGCFDGVYLPHLTQLSTSNRVRELQTNCWFVLHMFDMII